MSGKLKTCTHVVPRKPHIYVALRLSAGFRKDGMNKHDSKQPPTYTITPRLLSSFPLHLNQDKIGMRHHLLTDSHVRIGGIIGPAFSSMVKSTPIPWRARQDKTNIREKKRTALKMTMILDDGKLFLQQSGEPDYSATR